MSRRLVAVLFLDLVGWTELAERLDPEPLQEFLERYYEICVTAVEQHGGIVEKFIGDAIMAVFGTEHSQEDDALRALRTGFQVRAAIAGLEIAGFKDRPPEIHCGIAAGEALVTRSAHAGVRIVGDVVNLAARLQSKAAPGEVLVNEVMARLVRTQAAVAPVAPLTLKGKQEPVPTWRAIELSPANDPHAGVRLVDRQSELSRLLEAFHSVVDSRRLHEVTVLGPPGVGKSRLVQEVLARLTIEHPDVVAAAGVCPSYGATGSFGALAQIVDALRDDQLTALISETRGALVLDVLAHISTGSADNGHDSGSTPGVEEISWAAREFLAAAAARPLVLVWEDLQWAPPSLLDLISSITQGLADHPVLMIYVTRPELCASWLERPVDDLDVGPLARPDTLEFVSSLTTRLDPAEVTGHGMDLLERIADDSGGYPLYAELLVETLALGHPPGEMPPSITALVGAMLDRLPAASREALEAASVIGTTFTLAQVKQLDAEPTPECIQELVTRQLVECGSRPGEYRFAQQLVHEVVYGRLQKQQRLSWHRRLADLNVAPEFHLEAAVRLLREVRPDDPDLPTLASQAADALLGEGTFALRQRDLPAAIGLLARARDIAPGNGAHQRALAAIRLSDALLLSGHLAEACAVVTDVAEGASSPRASRACRVQQALAAIRSGQTMEVSVEELAAELEQDPDDHVSWCRFHQLQMLANLADGRFRAAEDAVSAALAHARAMGDAYEQDRLLAGACEVGQWSPAPIPDKLAACNELCSRFAADRFLLVPMLAAKARFLALTGDLAGARETLAETAQIVADLQMTIGQILVEQVSGLVSSLADDPVEARRHFGRAAEALTAAGHQTVALTMRVFALREKMRLDADADVAGEIEALAAERVRMDMRGRVLHTALAARAATTGDDAARVVEEVQRLLDNTDDPVLHGDAYVELAREFRHRGDLARCQTMADAAQASYAAVGATLPMSKVVACR